MEKIIEPKFYLGQKVYCFRPLESKLGDLKEFNVRTYLGFILGMSINAGGVLQYTVKSLEGEVGGTESTIAKDPEEMEEKISRFKEYASKQQELGESFFGKPEFDLNALVAAVQPEK